MKAMRPINADIPEDIQSAIRRIEAEKGGRDGHTRYYAYFEIQDGDLAIASIAVKGSTKRIKREFSHTTYMKKVAVHIIGDELCYCRDIKLIMIAGYITEFYEEEKLDDGDGVFIVNAYGDEEFWACENKYFHVFGPKKVKKFINPEFLTTIPEFKYSGFDYSIDAYDYLTAYISNPKIELLAKILNAKLATSTRIVALAAKEKAFVLWLRDNAEKIKRSGAEVGTIISAYRRKQDVEQMAIRQEALKYFRNTYGSEERPLPNIYKEGDDAFKERIIDYLIRNKITPHHFNDYIVALNALRISKADTKNLFPMDWAYWSEVRFNQYESLRQKQSEEAAKAMAEVAAKYASMTKVDGDFCVFIADSKEALVKEGNALSHCVGRMDYDQRIIKEKSLIFFIREKAAPQIPFVTVEFSISDWENGKVVQCYGHGDTRPSEAVREFVYNVFEPKAQARLKRIAAKEAA